MSSQDNSPDLRREANGMTEGAGRWTLSRAGIINVHQYDNEILHFAGGRLLLRGINGSGKSTAMNMLLPFLLDADTRRIDAAGEQSGMLRSWMLSGRDEPQPQGYLWLEVAKGDSYLAFGCGIRASRSAEQVTAWWFITSRRPGLDLHLVDGRVPLSREALWAAIGSDPVYGQEQRPDYRAELGRRLFGGADIEQHLHLLRIVRNPRVGDRLDAELPQYLQDALPQLSEAALDDAAQPLEDLEEHRRNVTDLGRPPVDIRKLSRASSRRLTGAGQVFQKRRNQLRYGRMYRHSPAQRLDGLICAHQVQDAVNRLIAAGSEDRGAQDSLRIGIRHDLHETLRLAFLDGATDSGHLTFGTKKSAPTLCRFGVRHSHSRERGVDVKRVAGHALAHASVPTIEQVGGDDLKVVVGCVREGTTPIAVPQRPDSGHVRLQPIVDDDIAARVGGNARPLEAEIVCVGPPPHRQEHMTPDHRGCAFSAVD